jgi:hypothetical protein
MEPRDGEQRALVYTDIMETGDEDNAECARADLEKEFPNPPKANPTQDH